MAEAPQPSAPAPRPAAPKPSAPPGTQGGLKPLPAPKKEQGLPAVAIVGILLVVLGLGWAVYKWVTAPAAPPRPAAKK